MKQRILAILLSLTMMFTLVPTAMAEGEKVAKVGETEYDTLQEAVDAATTENSTVTLLKDVTEDITIPTGKNITLDLGNSKLTNKSGDTITVELGATLTVTGNGESADEDGSAGTVDNTTHQKADIVNNGTVILNGGWYLRSEETGVNANTSGGNSYYNILNHGEMTINNDTMVMQEGKFSSLIVNGYYDYAGGSDSRQNYVDGINQAAPKLTINNGAFLGGVNTIKNDDGGELIINGGGFGNEEGCAVMNNTATINGGRFIATGNYVLYSRYINGTVNTGKLTVTNGKFEGNLAQINNAPIAISGGTFTTDPTAYLAEGYMSPKVGDSYKVGLETEAVAQIGDNKYTTLQDAFQAATAGDTVKLLTDVHTDGTDSRDARLTIGKPITLDLNEHTIYSPNDMGNNNTNFVALYVAADTTLKATTGGIDTGRNGGYAINVKDAKLTIDGGKYYGGGTAVQVQKGELTINNGYFDAEAFSGSYGYNFIINCIDSAYKDGTAKVAIKGGYFAHFDPANNKAEGAGTNFVADNCISVTSDKSGYDYKVVQNTDTGSIVVKPAVAEPEVNVDKISESDKQAVGNAAKSVAVPTLGAAAGDKVAAINKTEAEDLAAKAPGLQNPTLYVQTALKVEPTAYSAENQTLTLDITPQYRIVASTAATADGIKLSGDSKNAQVVQDYQKLTITAPTVVTMELPTGFVADGVDKLSIKHIKGNGTVEYYTGIVTETSGTKTLTFTTNGFSPFVISSAVASIDGVMYPTLAEAVANVDSGKTIKLEADCAEAVTVSRTVKFTLDKSSHVFTGSIKAGSYTTVTATDTEPVEYTFTYSRPSSGSSSYDPTYSVTVDKTENGSVTVSPKSASKGSTVTITVKPDSGYVLETLTVTDKNGNELTLKDKGDGKYTFTMPAGKVEVKATFMEDNSVLNFFYDVPNGAYFCEAVKWAVDKGITNGLSDTMFGPYESCTRAQIVTFLWRAAGSPEPKAASSFTDVPANAYYAKAVAWAVENGITNGMTATMFAPDATCTRGQSVTFLYRALKGTASGSANFTDVKSDAFYADAINWAVANNVTNGTSNTTFSPNADCTRAEIVTFLYRAYQGK